MKTDPEERLRRKESYTYHSKHRATPAADPGPKCVVAASLALSALPFSDDVASESTTPVKYNPGPAPPH